MRFLFPSLLCLALAGFSIVVAEDASKPIFIRAIEASERVGDKVLVEGTVANVTVTENPDERDP